MPLAPAFFRWTTYSSKRKSPKSAKTTMAMIALPVPPSLWFDPDPATSPVAVANVGDRVKPAMTEYMVTEPTVYTVPSTVKKRPVPSAADNIAWAPASVSADRVVTTVATIDPGLSPTAVSVTQGALRSAEKENVQNRSPIWAFSLSRCTVVTVFKSLSTMVSVTSVSPSERTGAAVGGTLGDDVTGSWVGAGDVGGTVTLGDDVAGSWVGAPTLGDDVAGSWVGADDGVNVSPDPVGAVVAGAAVGLEDGSADGVRVGPAVGLSDGAVLGPRLGENVSPDRVGAVVAGAAVGLEDGLVVVDGVCVDPALGFSDGAVLGPRLGSAVGVPPCSVGGGSVVGPSVGVAVKQGGCSSGSVRRTPPASKE